MKLEVNANIVVSRIGCLGPGITCGAPTAGKTYAEPASMPMHR
jgi:hypothetical protein